MPNSYLVESEDVEPWIWRTDNKVILEFFNCRRVSAVTPMLSNILYACFHFSWVYT